MSLLNKYRMIDIMSQMDLTLLEDIFLDDEVDKLFSGEKQKWSKLQIAVVSGIVASSVALTGVVVLLCKKYNNTHKAA